ncbi:MAG: ferritin [Muribaculaceae bacterium]|nr:ferritin [Muribaculaceae bacterium]
MISKSMSEALNGQINLEMWSSYLYLSMSLYFESEGRRGFAKWYRVQSQEEYAHALALIDYVHARGSRAVLQPITGVPAVWNSTLDAVVATLKHEEMVTAQINALYTQAIEEKDYATRQMLNAFIAEQVDEEETVQHIIDDLSLVGDDGTGLLQIDRELGTRTYKEPSFGRNA